MLFLSILDGKKAAGQFVTAMTCVLVYNTQGILTH